MSALVPVEYCRETLQITKNIEESFLILGERLYRIKTDSLFKGSWESFAEFLAEAKINEATASKLITVYRTFVEQYGVERDLLVKAGWNALYETTPLITSPKDAQSYAEKAATLRREDLREEVREAKVGAHSHQWEAVSMRRCTVCNKLEKV